MKKPLFALALLFSLVAGRSLLSAMSTDERRDYLTWMQASLPDVPTWNDWAKQSGELPPDFDQLPRNNALPDPLRFLDGRAVQTDADWTARKAEIRQQRHPAIRRTELERENYGLRPFARCT